MQTTLDIFIKAIPKWHCVFCKRLFAKQSELVNHLQHHNFVACEQCAAIFNKEDDYRLHLELHACQKTNENVAKRAKFACDQCRNVTFSCKDNLRRHMLQQHSLLCKHCNVACSTVESRKDHEMLHVDAGYGFAQGCEQCDIYCLTQEHLQFHIANNHKQTQATRSEEDLAAFLKSHGVLFTRDWQNRIKLPQTCKLSSARPDFFLYNKSREKNITIFIDNDEKQHKRYPNEFERMRGIEATLSQIEETKNMPILLVRFNPGSYTVDGIVRSNTDLKSAHERLLETIDNLQVSRLTKGLNLIFMFYDTTHGKLNCLSNNPEWEQKVLQIVT